MRAADYYTICDTLQMTFEGSDSSEKLTGKSALTISGTPGPLRIPMELIANYAGSTLTGVIVKFGAKGYLYIWHHRENKMVNLQLIDADKLGYHPNRKIPPFNESGTGAYLKWAEALKPGVIETFGREEHSGRWKTKSDHMQ